jgi:Ca2+-binding RTX toxin-like protein
MANIPGTPGDDVLPGGAQNDTITGADGNDVLAGLDGNDDLNGGPGNDVMVGGRGTDTVTGEAGNDVIVWNNGDGSDLMDGGADTDVQVVNGALADADDFRVDAGAGGAAVFQRVNLVPFALTMDAVETLDVRGLGGDDRFIVGNLGGTDLQQVAFRGGAGNDWLHASATATPLLAFGEDGNDILYGGTGDDFIDGGAGADYVVYGAGGGRDTVVVDAADVVELRGLASAVLTSAVEVSFGESSLLLDFGGGDALTLQWQPGAFAAADFYASHVWAS